VAAYGFNQVGNGSTSIPSLLTSGQSLSQLNIRLLQQSDFDALDDLEMGFQAGSAVLGEDGCPAQCLNGSVSRICGGGEAKDIKS